jgi:hypothetical protein
MVTKKKKVGFVEAIAPRPKTQTEMKRRVRSLSSTDAAIAVEWLNEAQHTAAYRRVLMVRGELEELGETLERLRQQRQEWKSRKFRRSKSDAEILNNLSVSTSMATLQEHFREHHNALNLRLARYAHVPALAYNLDSGIWRFGMVPKRPGGPEIVIEDQLLRVRINEAAVIAALCRLAANRELHKVRLCEMCGERWRISERQIDRFCSPKCRDAFHINSPDYKERKAANQRKYREGLKRAHANGVTLR